MPFKKSKQMDTIQAVIIMSLTVMQPPISLMSFKAFRLVSLGVDTEDIGLFTDNADTLCKKCSDSKAWIQPHSSRQ